MPQGKILIVTMHNSTPNVKMIATQKDKDFSHRIEVDNHGTLWMAGGSPRYTEEHKWLDIISIVIDWSSFPKDFPKSAINDIGSELEKLHPDIPIVQVEK